MNILFIHQNFPAQFKFLAPALSELGHNVRALGLNKSIPANWNGIDYCSYNISTSSSQNIHPWLVDFEFKLIRGAACYDAALELTNKGFIPNLIIAHHGWGESMFLKDIWPEAKLAIYCEFFYQNKGSDIDFDPEFSRLMIQDPRRIRIKNLNNLLHFDLADAGISLLNGKLILFPNPFDRK